MPTDCKGKARLFILLVLAFTIGSWGGYNNGYAEGLKLNAQQAVNPFASMCPVSWIHCRTRVYYDPVINNFLAFPPQITEGASVNLTFRNGGPLRWDVFGGLTHSMSPTIETGYIVISQYYPTKINVGDIVRVKSEKYGYKEGYGYIVHRIIGYTSEGNQTYYITKGDDNFFNDTMKIKMEDIEGRVVAIIPSGL